MFKVRYSSIAKYLIIFLIFYLFFFKYVYGEKHIILYGCTIIAVGCATLDLLLAEEKVLDVFPLSVLVNVIMCVYSLLTGLLVAANKELLINTVKTYAAFSFVCLCICYISKAEKGIDWLADTIIIINAITSVYILFRGTYFAGYGYTLPNQNPNGLGTVMDLGIFCIAYKSKKGKKHALIYIGLLFLFLNTIIGCGSRKCLFAALIICTLWLIPVFFHIWSRSTWGIRALLACSIIILSIGVVYYYQNVYVNTYSFSRMENLGDSKEMSSRNREIYYRFAIEYFLQRPIFGIGLNQFCIWNPYGQYAHSSYAEAIADWGSVGCLIYFIPVLWAGIKLTRISFIDRRNDLAKVYFALWAMEMFLGVGQIWFYDFEHLIPWTIIFIYIDMYSSLKNKEIQKKERCRYVKA